MSAHYPGTPVVAPPETSLLDHVSRHYFSRTERWFMLGDIEHMQRWAVGFRTLRAVQWKPGIPTPDPLPTRWRAPLADASPAYVALALEAVEQAIRTNRVLPCEPAAGAYELRLSYVGDHGVFVVAAATGAQRPFRTAYRPRPAARLGQSLLPDDATFLASARRVAEKRRPADSARWRARAVRRQTRLASSQAKGSGASGARGAETER